MGFQFNWLFLFNEACFLSGSVVDPLSLFVDLDWYIFVDTIEYFLDYLNTTVQDTIELFGSVTTCLPLFISLNQPYILYLNYTILVSLSLNQYSFWFCWSLAARNSTVSTLLLPSQIAHFDPCVRWPLQYLSFFIFFVKETEEKRIDFRQYKIYSECFDKPPYDQTLGYNKGPEKHLKDVHYLKRDSKWK